jgi:adenylosuccinate synthase
MPTLVVVGAQWGDEAKGKLVDVLGGEADLVVRYAGGNNAGHTVIANGKEYKFQLIPSGILHQNTTSILGSGMVICPKGLLDEMDRTRAITSDLGQLKISSAAHVVFPYHRLLDSIEEETRGEAKLGTTNKGIGPAYQDKVARLGIRMSEFVSPDRFEARLCEVLRLKNKVIQAFGREPLEFEPMFQEYAAYAERIRPYVCDTDAIIQEAAYGGKRVLFEGAQGSFLDIDAGTYPYVTSSHPTSGGATLGTGIGPRMIQSVLGVCKAYTTRVGAGPFPTELHDEIGEGIRQRGREFGTVTGRSRRIGWLDLVVLLHSSRLNSLSGLVITRLDILSGLEKIQVATEYRLGDSKIRHVPSDIVEFSKVAPVMKELQGWGEDLQGCRSIDELPKAARAYLDFIEDAVQTPVAMVSVGPDREETIVVRPDLIWSK